MQNQYKKRLILFIKNRLIRVINIFRTIDIFDMLFIFLENIVKKGNLIWVENISIKEYCIEHNEEIIEIEEEKDRPVYSPAFFELKEAKEYHFKSPEIYIACLHNVEVLGETGIVLGNNKALFDSPKYDTEKRIEFRFGPLKKYKNNQLLLAVKENNLKVDYAINLCGFAPRNYYHFTMEIMSRLDYVKKIEGLNEYTILLDESINNYYQLQQMVKIFCENKKILYIPSGKCAKVNYLIQPSMNTWMPINVKSRELFKISDNLLAKSGIENIRLRVSDFIRPQTKKKIFLTRINTNTVRISNESDVIKWFHEEGFEIVYTENLDYLEQIELFSSAKCIVGSSGAALTNLLYCHSGTVFGCIIPEEYDFCMYSTIMYHIGGIQLFLNAEIVSKNLYIAADKYVVDEKKCKRYIQEIKKMCE